jgi:nucleoid DNA-binding protein
VTKSEFVEQVAVRAGLSRNPATGERIQIAATRPPRFTAGSGLENAIKGA